MKKQPIIMLVLFVAISAAAYHFISRTNYEEETTPLVVGAVTAISDGWDVEELKAWSDPGLIKAMASQGQSAEQLMGIYSALGKLKEAPNCQARATGMTMKNSERHDTVSHECTAEYEKGPAKISITVIKAKSAEEWQIYYINIHSDVFANASQ